MDYGAHLPLIGFDDRPYSLSALVEYTEAAQRLGFKALAANDHLVFGRPWLDGLTALSAVLPYSGDMTLMTTVALPIVRGPVALAKTMAALDIFSGGRMTVGVGPGSSARDYATVSIPFEERWKRLDEAIQVMRSLWDRGGQAFTGHFYSTEGVTLEPYPLQQPGPPIWIGSWGSEAGLRRTAGLGDGWLASAYNTTPEDFSSALEKLKGHLTTVGKDPSTFPNALATTLLYITEDKNEATRIIEGVIHPAITRPLDELRSRLLVGSAEDCASKLSAYSAAGLQRVLVWPVADEVRQLELFMERVAPSV